MKRIVESYLVALALAAGQPALAGEAEVAEYQVVFTGAWTAESHPLEYPKAGLLTGPHFSGLIGASHSPAYALVAEGKQPSAGLERLAEEGKHSPLDQEIRAAIAAGKAGALFETGPIRDMSKPAETTVKVDAAHSRVSAVAMIAPSPDWFAGAADVELRENGRWVDSKEVALYAFDAGSDDGTTYEAPDQDANPKHPTVKNGSPHFRERAPVGRLTFTRVSKTASTGSR